MPSNQTSGQTEPSWWRILGPGFVAATGVEGGDLIAAGAAVIGSGLAVR
ncbi:MAG: hypothetical protein R3F07_17210 [Opitutaceae bacterium]